jgi:hypothetical protein
MTQRACGASPETLPGLAPWRRAGGTGVATRPLMRKERLTSLPAVARYRVSTGVCTVSQAQGPHKPVPVSMRVSHIPLAGRIALPIGVLRTPVRSVHAGFEDRPQSEWPRGESNLRARSLNQAALRDPARRRASTGPAPARPIQPGPSRSSKSSSSTSFFCEPTRTNPHFSSTRIEATLLVATHACSGRWVTSPVSS